jgi:class 3 adenylate cyclase
MFTDIVSSTERAAAVGDRRWRELLDGYVGVARRHLEQFRGREIDVAGDGLFAVFDGPRERSAVPVPSATRSTNSASRYGRGFTPGNARSRDQR